ncbi:Putative DNA-binding protein [hydrothermal vent metagenome]|uniref:DNA-binding protein n=1 Tax=hydrothermal vent metagenome TaxID=652676 RepID=A0A3B1BVA9_9ZZZZ
MSKLIPSENIETKIYLIRGNKVMMDSDLALLYEIPTKRLLEQVRRNVERFPEDFMLQLTKEEYDFLRSQIATSKKGSGGRRYLPYAFTEQGVAMLSSVLKSKRAIEVNIAIMRAFVKLRKMLASNDELKRKLAAMERKYDSQFKVVFDAIKQLMTDDIKPKRKIGFVSSLENNPKKKRKGR